MTTNAVNQLDAITTSASNLRATGPGASHAAARVYIRSVMAGQCPQ